MKFSRILVQNDATPFEDSGTSDFTNLPNRTVQLVNAGDTQPTNGSAPGDTIDTSADLGSSLDVTDYDEVQLAFRDRENNLVEVSPVIPTDELEVSDMGYVRPSQQVMSVNFPSSPASDEMWTLKVTDLESGNQPFQRRSYEVEIGSGFTNAEIVEAFVDAINDREDQINDWDGASVYAGVNYATQNAEIEVSSPSAGDTLDVTIESTTYSEDVVGGDELQTVLNFIDSHADDIFDSHGVSLRADVDGNSDLFLYQSEGYDLDMTFTGDLSASISGANGTTVNTNDASGTEELRLTATDVGDIFDIASRNFDADSVTTQFRSTDGVGTFHQVSKYEEQDRGTSGRYVQSNNLLGSLPSPPSYAQQNTRYDLLTFSFPGDSEKAVNKSISPQHYIVALSKAAHDNATESNGTAGVDDFREFFDPVTVASNN